MKVKQKAVRIVFSALLALPFASCKKEQTPPPPSTNEFPTTLTVNVYPTYGSDTLYLDSTFQTAEGYDVQFTDILFYGTDLKHGDNFLTTASLFDYRETGNFFIGSSLTPEDFPSLQGFLGVQATQNHADPSAFPNHSALNIVNAGGMHWGWNPGYIFIKVEARVDTIPDGNPLFDHNVVLHVGTDAFLQTLDFPQITWINAGNNQHVAKMRLDMQQFLVNGAQTIDLKTEYITHSGAGQEALSAKAIQNFKAALSFTN